MIILLYAFLALPLPLAAALSEDNHDNNRTVALFYLHARKCGGSTVGNYLRNWLSEHGCCGSEERCKAAPYFMSSATLRERWHCNGAASKPVIHFLESEYQCVDQTRFLSLSAPPSLPPPLPAVAFLSVIILRHPIDRYLSLWWYHGGPGHAMLSKLVTEHCNSSFLRGAGSLQISSPGMKQRPCYREAFRAARSEASHSKEAW